MSYVRSSRAALIRNVPSFAALRSPSVKLSPVTLHPRRVIGVGLLTAGTIVALFAATQAIDFGVFNLRIRWLNADHHASVFAVASLLAQAATAAVAIARGHYAVDRRRAWFALGGLVGVLVVVRGLATFNAALLAAPLACVFASLCVLTWSDHTSRQVVWAGLVLLAVSLLLHKVGLDADSSTASDYTWPYQLVGIVKHGAELAGWMLVATGVAAGVPATMSPAPAGASARPPSAVGIAPNTD